ncbi:MAG TPA: EamA family transporter [Burkholderiales bacterium]|nr:EamA family transporter [Burkholderiales bacterium]
MNPGIAYALLGAALFGASTPIAKLLVGEIAPVMLAGLLYAGSGVGLGLWLAVRGSLWRAAERPRFAPGDYKWLAGAVVSGGVIGPALLMFALAASSASSVSLLLNLESVFTALLAWFVFRENFDRRLMLGMSLIVCGGVILGWRPGDVATSWPALAVAGACLCWALDNNLTRKISAGDSVKIAGIKGLAAGAVNLCVAAAFGAALPAPKVAAAAALVGLLGYGVSLALFVVALRHLGTARTGAYFSTAPFIGAAASFALLGEAPDTSFWVAAGLMAVGVALHLTERHRHTHRHEALTHAHPHTHDEHHRHQHDFAWDGTEPHSHTHAHDRLSHSHAHFPDIHHRHSH